jgi:hypothetical protein
VHSSLVSVPQVSEYSMLFFSSEFSYESVSKEVGGQMNWKTHWPHRRCYCAPHDRPTLARSKMPAYQRIFGLPASTAPPR